MMLCNVCGAACVVRNLWRNPYGSSRAVQAAGVNSSQLVVHSMWWNVRVRCAMCVATQAGHPRCAHERTRRRRGGTL
eukprot:5916020-Pyramimonas_sp.AAC.1